MLLCCCLVTAVLESADDPLDWKQVLDEEPEPVTGPRTSLGVVLIPDDTPSSRAKTYAWRAHRDAYELGYGVSVDEHDAIETSFARLADTFDYRPGVGSSFTWAPPTACRKREWECVFDTLAQDNGDDIEALTELFRKRQQSEHLDMRQITELVVSFVQNIRYRLPTEDTAAFGLLPPTIVVADGSGDCDSKALLATIILQQLGVDATVLLATNLGHAALGVALPVPGKKFVRGKHKYAFVEVTTPGWALGVLPPDYDVPSAWKVIPVTVK